VPVAMMTASRARCACAHPSWLVTCADRLITRPGGERRCYLEESALGPGEAQLPVGEQGIPVPDPCAAHRGDE